MVGKAAKHPKEIGRSHGSGETITRFARGDVGIYPSTGGAQMMNSYPVHFMPTATGFAAYVPDLPGCVAAGDTLDETRALIAGALSMHLEAMIADGDDIQPPSLVEIVEPRC